MESSALFVDGYRERGKGYDGSLNSVLLRHYINVNREVHFELPRAKNKSGRGQAKRAPA
jgi:hypothetical protein